MTTHRAECKCIVCARPTRGRTCVKVCLSIPADLWSAFGDECLLAGRDKSPTVAGLIALWLKHRKEKKA